MPPEKSTSITHRALPPLPKPGTAGLLQRGTQARAKPSGVLWRKGHFERQPCPGAVVGVTSDGARPHPFLSRQRRREGGGELWDNKPRGNDSRRSCSDIADAQHAQLGQDGSRAKSGGVGIRAGADKNARGIAYR
jgi:hypothetical protein